MSSKRFAHLALFTAGALALAGCDGGDSEPRRDSASDRHGYSGAPVIAAFDPTIEVLPFPANLMFLDTPDGTINVPNDDPTAADFPIKAALNSLDGFSTIAPWRTTFKGAVDPGSVLPGQSVRVFKAHSNDALLPQPVAFERELQPGVDYEVRLAGNNDELVITPLRPLEEQSYYIAVLTNDITDPGGRSVSPSIIYAIAKSRSPVGDDSDAEKMRQMTDRDLSVLEEADQIRREDVVLSWSVKTQSVFSTLKNARRDIQPTEIELFDVASAPDLDAMPLIRAMEAPKTPDNYAYIWPGTIELPYFLTHVDGGSPDQPNYDTRPLYEHWSCGGGECAAPASAQYSPDYTATQVVPLIAAVPDEKTTGLTMPAEGWPLVIFGHTIQQNRTTALGIADALAQKGFAVMAIDLPLHGMVLNQMDPENNELDAQLVDLHAHTMSEATDFDISLDIPLLGSILNPLLGGIGTYVIADRFLKPHQERTMYLNLLDENGVLAAEGETSGKVDPSGAHFVNPESMLVFRDNMRQAVVDLMTLTATVRAQNIRINEVKALNSLCVFGTNFNSGFQCGSPNPKFDPNNVYFLGHGLGAMIGVPFLALEDGVKDASLAMGSSGIARMLEGSEVVGPLLREGLIAAGQEPGSPSWNQFFAILQAALDAAEPANYADKAANDSGIGEKGTGGKRNIHLIDIVGGNDSPADLVIPVTVEHEPLSGSAPLARLLGARQAPNADDLLTEIDGKAWAEADDEGRLNVRVGFRYGNHASLLLPDTVFENPASGEEVETPRADEAYDEMQEQVASFLKSARDGLPRLEIDLDLVEPAH